jgi:hypothetical protein
VLFFPIAYRLMSFMHGTQLRPLNALNWLKLDGLIA